MVRGEGEGGGCEHGWRVTLHFRGVSSESLSVVSMVMAGTVVLGRLFLPDPCLSRVLSVLGIMDVPGSAASERRDGVRDRVRFDPAVLGRGWHGNCADFKNWGGEKRFCVQEVFEPSRG